MVTLIFKDIHPRYIRIEAWKKFGVTNYAVNLVSDRFSLIDHITLQSIHYLRNKNFYLTVVKALNKW